MILECGVMYLYIDCDQFFLIPFNFSADNQPFKLCDTK